MKKMLFYGIAALVLIGTGSCKSRQKETNKSTPETVDVAGIEKAIVEKYWKLTTVFGETVVTPEGGREAHIILKKENRLVNGNTGCNSLGGTYILEAGNKINFSQTISTLMMCLNDNVESKFKHALELTDTFVVNGDTLRFYDANKEAVASFEAVYLR
jgi:heat shock protein HslJ